MAIDSTIGGALSESFVSVEYADAYFDSHWKVTLQTAWSALSVPQKEAVLKRATQVIETYRFLDADYGSDGPLALSGLGVTDAVFVCRQFSDQALQFPRNIDLDAAGNAVIPQRLQDAQCEQAVFLLTADDSALATQLSGVSEEAASAGPVRLYQHFTGDGSLLAPMAYELLKRYLRKSTGMRRA